MYVIKDKITDMYLKTTSVTGNTFDTERYLTDDARSAKTFYDPITAQDVAEEWSEYWETKFVVEKHDFLPNTVKGLTTYTPPETKTDAVKYCEEHFPLMTQEFKRLMQTHYELFCAKQVDYGPGNIALGTNLSKPEQIKASVMGVVFRTNDKIQRLMNLVVIKQRDAENESIADSWMDIVNYGIIAQIVTNGLWGK